MKYRYILIITFFSCLSFSCQQRKKTPVSANGTVKGSLTENSIDTMEVLSHKTLDTIRYDYSGNYDSLLHKTFDYSSISLSNTEKAMADAGLVDIHDVLPNLVLDLRYTTTNNFVAEVLYPETKRCFLRIETIVKLCKALHYLQSKHPTYTFVIYDGARPQSVQYKMYEIATKKGQSKYVAKPEKGGLHNFGVAVDIGLYDMANNTTVDMGTDFDFFGPEAQPRFHTQMLAEGKLTQTQIDNRNLLKAVMKQAGFIAILTEWWHFEAFNKEYTRANFPIVK